MLPPFGRSGLLPPGDHLGSWPEFLTRFEGEAGNGRRRRLMQGLARVLLHLAAAGCATVWIDGSFVSRERWPRDFDLCYDPRGVTPARLPPVLQDLSSGRRAQKLAFGGEALPADFPFNWGGLSVRQVFARSREGEAKGVVELNLSTQSEAIAAFVREKVAVPPHPPVTEEDQNLPSQSLLSNPSPSEEP